MSMNRNGNQITPLELETLSFTRNDIESSSQQQQQQKPFDPFICLQNLAALVLAYGAYYSQIVVPIAAICLVVAVVLTLDFVVSASAKSHIASVKIDYSSAHSEYDLMMKSIDHWCLSGGDDDCKCDDPTLPISNERTKGWIKAHNLNKLLLEPSSVLSGLDVVIVGDESVEEWNGRWFGAPMDKYKEAKTYFDENFNRTKGGKVNGLALGVAKDTISNLYWRLKHGEMPKNLNPKVWWILIGNNDLIDGQCSEEAVVLGILRLAEFIAHENPGATIVLNSILPAFSTIEPNVPHSHFKPFELFPSIKVVNEELLRFSKHNADIKFFNASQLFLKEKQPSKTRLPSIKSDLINDKGQLTVEGHKIWGDAILQEVSNLMTDNPDDASDDYGPMDD